MPDLQPVRTVNPSATTISNLRIGIMVLILQSSEILSDALPLWELQLQILIVEEEC